MNTLKTINGVLEATIGGFSLVACLLMVATSDGEFLDVYFGGFLLVGLLPTFAVFVLHVVAVSIANAKDLRKQGSVWGIVSAVFSIIPFVSSLLRITAAILLFREVKLEKKIVMQKTEGLPD